MRLIFVHISRLVTWRRACAHARRVAHGVPRPRRQCSGRAFARAKGCAFATTKARRDGGDDDGEGRCAMQCASQSSFVIRHSFARVANVGGVVVNVVPNAVGLPRETTGG